MTFSVFAHYSWKRHCQPAQVFLVQNASLLRNDTEQASSFHGVQENWIVALFEKKNAMLCPHVVNYISSVLPPFGAKVVKSTD
jgi:hypothetical protein